MFLQIGDIFGNSTLKDRRFLGKLIDIISYWVYMSDKEGADVELQLKG